MKRFEASYSRRLDPGASDVEVKRMAIPQGEETYILCRTAAQGEGEGDRERFFHAHGGGS